MNIILVPLINIILIVLDLYMNAVFISVIISWLVAFNIINVNNHFVYIVRDFLYRITEPLYKKIRKFIPVISGIDFCPFVLILAIYFVKSVIIQIAALL